MSLFAEIQSVATQPILGVLIFILGGLASAVFYLPFKKVKNWAWESYWLVYAVLALLVAPWVLAFATSPNVVSVLKATPHKELGYCFVCGAMWGLGGMTWGLMIRYLGVGLGLAIGCGLCSASGTLVPPIIKGEFMQLIRDNAGQLNYPGLVSLGGVAISLLGIVFVGGAGMSKENELPEEVKKATVAEYNFKLGLCVAIFSGLMSGAINFGFQGGGTMEALACPLFTSSQLDGDKIPEFVAQLKDAKPDTVPGFLFQQAGPKTKELLTKFDDKKKGERSRVQSALTDDLNHVIQAGDIFNAERFANVKLSDETKKLASTKQTETASIRLNRRLLEESLPDVIKVHSPQLAVIDQSVTTPTWRGIPVLVVVLLGGFVVNFAYCILLNLKNKTAGDYVKSGTPLATNYFFAGLAGVIWCSQFICLKTGEPAMGSQAFVGFAVLMAGAILFSTVIGIFLGEWRNTSSRTRLLLTLGLVLLVASSVVSGYSSYLKQ
jgi:hypothetical protein